MSVDSSLICIPLIPFSLRDGPSGATKEWALTFLLAGRYLGRREYQDLEVVYRSSSGINLDSAHPSRMSDSYGDDDHVVCRQLYKRPIAEVKLRR